MKERKLCPGCGIRKTRTNFHRNKTRKDGLGFYCKECRNKKAKGRKEGWRELALWKLYKLTLKEYNVLYDKQKGCCAVCGKHQSEIIRPLFVDHNHETKKIRGLLCGQCNFGLGQFNDSSKLLGKAQRYLLRTN